MVLGLHDDTAAEETEAAHHAGRDTGRVEPGGSFKAELRNDHEHRSAQRDEHVRTHARALGADFPLIADDRAHKGGGQHTDG